MHIVEYVYTMMFVYSEEYKAGYKSISESVKHSSL